MKPSRAAFCVLSLCFAVALPAAELSSTNDSWSGKQAAQYLDSRMTWWTGWSTASRDHETFCVSCHTVAPFAMARPSLRTTLAESSPSPIEHKLLDNVTKRVRLWKETEPFYPDKPVGPNKTVESRGTESILNALILTRYDAGAGSLGADARLALGNMWAQQITTGDTKGAFPWLQFHNSPWEGDSQYYGATLAAIAIGAAHETYRNSPEIQNGLDMLRGYLIRDRDSQVLINRVTLLWAASGVSGILTQAAKQAIIDEALSKQQADGGFSLTAFVGDWKRHDNTPLEFKSDGYATGLVAFALQKAGVPASQPQLKNALAWLQRSQDKTDGRWLAYSLNKQRDLSSDVGRFMSDAATAYAILALKGLN